MRYIKTQGVFVRRTDTTERRAQLGRSRAGEGNERGSQQCCGPKFMRAKPGLQGIRYFSQSVFPAHILVVLLTFLATWPCSAQETSTSVFRPTDTGSTITFEIKNFGINT